METQEQVKEPVRQAYSGIALQGEEANQSPLPGDILSNYLSAEEIMAYKKSNSNIQSITVYAEKPGKDERKCCEPGTGCC
jgi:hypothetical protein